MNSSCYLRAPKSIDDSRVRIFCFPHAGGGASAYYRWGKSASNLFCIWPVHLPGREGRIAEPPFHSLPALMEDFIPELATHASHPSILYGHSFGSLLAYESAARLELMGRQPIALVISASPPPNLKRRFGGVSS
ncbi:MAG: thioesterase, partial [Planctomycetales bacterium]|nr:thioesterase [Planctomycetales bacterium]